MPPKSVVLLPLYIYPLPGAWEPLYSAIAENPDVQFIIILNPHNGPGKHSLPDESYSEQIPKLNVQPNVTTVGYVRVDYCKRNIKKVFDDVAKYAAWGTQPNLGVQGIFLDETPNLFMASKVSYLDTVNQQIKASAGLLGKRLVIHNPGTVPDPEFANPGPDITTVVEESYANYYKDSHQERLSKLLRYGREKCAYMVYSVPKENMLTLVNDLRHRGEYLFVTDLSKDYYCKFGPSWKQFIKAMQNQ